MCPASTVWYRPPKIPEASKTHALVIGTSKYDHLPTKTLKLGQLDCAASAAYEFARWLKHSYRNDLAPLASIRGLAAPSDLERTAYRGNDVLLWPQSTGDQVQEALERWQDDCFDYPRNVAILYVSGHGIVESPDHPYVLLQDIGRHDNFNNALSIAPTQIALGVRTLAASAIFVDSCQQLSPKPEWDLSGGRHLNAPRIALNESRFARPIYFAAATGAAAFGVAGESTFFCRALLRCLDVLAVRPVGKPPTWAVTTTSLAEALMTEIARTRPKQRVQPGGSLGLRNIHVPERAPTLASRFRLRPAQNLPWARGLLRNASPGAASIPLNLQSSEFQEELACGDYILRVSSTPPPRFNEREHHFTHIPPDGADIEIDIE